MTRICVHTAQKVCPGLRATHTRAAVQYTHSSTVLAQCSNSARDSAPSKET